MVIAKQQLVAKIFNIMEPQNKIPYGRINFTGKIHLITCDQELAGIVPNLSSAKFLGFDTETRASFKVGDVYKVALLQLATETDAYLIRLHNINKFEFIKNIFEEDSNHLVWPRLL